MGTINFSPKILRNVFYKFKNYGDKNGFTLLELIIALTILTLIIVLAFGSFRIGLKAWETGDKRIDLLYRMKFLVDLMEKEISSSYPHYYFKDDKKKETILAFTGLEDSVSFMSSLESNDLTISNIGLREVSFYIDRGEDKKEHLLMMTEEIIQTPQTFGETVQRTIRSIVLAKDVIDITFRYYKLKSGSPGKYQYEGEWVDNYTSPKEEINEQVLPRAIEVTVTVETNKKGINKSIETFYLPPFIIPLNAGMEYRFNKKE